MAWTWTELLDEIKVRAMMPTANDTFTSARLLNLANKCLWSEVVPYVNSVREGYFSYDVTFAVNSNTEYYRIPSRAVGGKLENIYLLRGTDKLDLNRFYEDDTTSTQEAPSYSGPGVYLKRDKVYLRPLDGDGYSSLVMTIVMRPNELVTQSDAAQITGIASNVLTCSTVPSSWTSSNTFDLVQQNPHFDWLGIDLAASAVTTGASGTITLSTTPSSDLAVGDWVSLAGKSPVVQLPAECFPLLAQSVAVTLLRSQGDKEALGDAIAASGYLKEQILSLLTPRIEEEGKKIVNRTGILRRGM